MKKLKIKSDDLIAVLEPLQVVINPNHIVPILQCVHIKSQDDGLYVTGDNHEVRCQNAIDNLMFKDDFEFCVNFQLLLTALKSVNKQEIKIKIDYPALVISHSKGDFKLPLEDTSAFPKSTDEELSNKATIDTKSLKKSLKVANRFLLNDDLEPMSNLSIEIAKKKTTIRSTNKISLFQEKIKGGGDAASILISGKTSSSIHFLLEDEKDEVELKYNESKIFFKFGKKEVMAVQQQGNFPLPMFNKIMDSIDVESDDLVVDKKLFVTSLKRVSSLSIKEKSHKIKLKLDKKNLNLSCDNEMSSSKVKEDLPIKFKGSEKEIGYNAKLLIEILSVFEDNNTDFRINKSNCFCIKTKKMSGLIAPLLLSNND